MNIKPTGTNVLLRLEPAPETTASGLYYGTGVSTQHIGTILGVGNGGGPGIPDESDLGRKAILSKGYEPLFEVKDDEGQDWVIVKHEDVCAVHLE